MSFFSRKFGILLIAACLGVILIGWNARITQAGVSPATAPQGYIVFDRLPWDTNEHSSVRVSRTGRLYKTVYDSASLTAYTSADYHPAQKAMTDQQRGAIDFGVNANVRVLSVAHGCVYKVESCGQLSVKHDNGMIAYYIHMSEIAVKPKTEVFPGTYLGRVGSRCADAAHLHFALWNGKKEVPVAFSNVPAQTSNGKTCPASVICPSKKDYVEFRYGGSSTLPPTPPPPTPPPPTGPSGYTFCALENQRCSFSGVKDVAYGAGGQFAYRYALSNGIDCNNATFGDPIYGVVKACFYKDTPPFNGNVSSALNITTAQARLDVCANNIPGRPVYATLYRGPVGTIGERLWRFTINTPGNATCITFVDMDGAGDTLQGVTYYTVASTRPISDADAKAKRSSCFSATGGYQLCDARAR